MRRVRIVARDDRELALEQAVQEADVVIVATNHSEFEGPAVLSDIVSRAGPDCLLVDPWNALGTGQVFVFAAETAVLAPSAVQARDAR